MSKSLAVKVDPRFLAEDGYEVFTGCELLVKGLLEVQGGTHLWTGYPGSPVAGFFDVIESIRELPKKYGIRATIANNEAISVAMVNGSQMLGLKGIAVMKSVGVHVAADAIALGNLAGAHRDGGAVIVLGDDPWSDSTQVPADSRFLAKHLFMPVLEPSDPQELKDWLNIAFKLSKASGFYTGYLVTTNQADGGGSVKVAKNHWPEVNVNATAEIRTASIPVDQTVLLPPRTGLKEEQLESRRRLLWDEAARLEVDRVIHPQPGSPIGFVTSGMAYTYLRHTLRELGLEGRFPILKLGLTYPIDPETIESFSKHVNQIVVVEERRAFIEEQILGILQNQSIPVWGKKLPHQGSIPSTLGLNPSVLTQCLAPFLMKECSHGMENRMERELALIRETSIYDVDIPSRTPSFCPGCPHRDSSSVLLEVKKSFRDNRYMRKQHHREPVDLVFHGDTGCYTMLMYEPNQDLMHNYSGMGLGGATGAGIDPFISNKQVVFMGDSTFFHSGQIAISNSIKNRQDITYIILDNKTTAMTGHQTTPNIEFDLLGNTQFQQSIDRILEGISGYDPAEIIRINPEYRDTYRHILEETILKDGVKIIIADKECGITFHRRKTRQERRDVKEKGYVPHKKHINITPEVCENCLECTKATGCPGLTFADTPYGTKIQTDLSWCVADTACAKTRACPSFEEVVVTRHSPPTSRLASLDLDHLPEPEAASSVSSTWHAYLAGVGGMGIGVATATLVRAGFREGYQVLFCDKKGLAIRNGGVYSQVSYFHKDQVISSTIPYGKANLLLGIDILEAVRALDPKSSQRIGSPHHTTAILNTEKTPTIHSLIGKSDFDPHDLEVTVQCFTQRKNYFGHNFSKLSEKYFGTKLFANIMMLGASYQKGLLPLRLDSLLWAIDHTMGPAAKDNIQAFQLGRKVVLEPEQFSDDQQLLARYPDIVQRKASYMERGHPQRKLAASAYQAIMLEAEASLTQLPEKEMRDLAIRIADLIWFENATYARQYLECIQKVYGKDRSDYGFAATRTAIWNLAKVMLIKDEVYVAHLLTSEEKLTRDRERYDVDPSRGDQIHYKHINRPRFDWMGFKIEFDIRTWNWQLNLMKRMKFLRRLLPDWHKPEKEFRNWYLALTRSFHFQNDTEYQTWIDILNTPASVTGYREIRHPKQEAARKKAESLLAGLKTSPSSDPILQQI